MNFVRMLIVVLLVTFASGTFGATVGGLVGFAVPSSLKIFVGVDATATESAKAVEPTPEPADSSTTGLVSSSRDMHTVGVGNPKRTHVAPEGAALGGAIGLILGGFMAIFIAIADQILLALRGAAEKRKPPTIAPRPAAAGTLPPHQVPDFVEPRNA